jgi:hypothetical protein
MGIPKKEMTHVPRGDDQIWGVEWMLDRAGKEEGKIVRWVVEW